MSEIDWEDLEQEDRMFPWLADGSMSDTTEDPAWYDHHRDNDWCHREEDCNE